MRLPKLAGHCWRGLTQLASAVWWQDSVISARWNFWWKPVSRPWRPFISLLRMAHDFYKRKTGLARWLRGNSADLVVVRGDPSSKISDIENVEIVFKDGVGYDPAKLLHSVRGQVGLR